MLKSELVDRLAVQHRALDPAFVKDSVDLLLNLMSQTLAEGDRIEIRGFGSFTCTVRAPKKVRNPRTGELLTVGPRTYVRFKPGKELAQRVDRAAQGLKRAA